MIRKVVSAGLVVGAAVLSGCTPQTEAARPTSSSATEAASSASPSVAPDPRPEIPDYDDFPEPEVGDPPLVVNAHDFLMAPGMFVYTTSEGDAVTGLASITLTGQPIASSSVTTTPTVSPGGTTPDLSCHLEARGIRGVWTLLTSSVVEHPATGTTPASYEIVFQGFDANFALLWTSEPLGPFAAPPACVRSDPPRGGNMINGDYVIREFDNFLVIVDLVNHTLVRSDLSNIVPWGDKFLTQDGQGGYQVLDPATLAQIAYIPPRASGGVIDPTLRVPFDEYDAVDIYAIGDGLATVDLDTGQGEWLIEPDDPRFGVFLRADYIDGSDVIVASVADSAAEGAPTTTYILAANGAILWSTQDTLCGSRDDHLVLGHDGEYVAVYDIFTGERVSSPASVRCDYGVRGYVGAHDADTFTFYRVV